MSAALYYLRTLYPQIRHSFVNVIWTGILFRALGVALFAPITGFLVSWFLARTGRSVLIDQDIATFLLEPFGFVASIIMLSIALTLLALEQGALLAIFHGAKSGKLVSASNAIKFALSRAVSIFELAGRIVLKLLILTLPFAGAAGLVYLTLLTEYDINYYLAERPGEYQLAYTLVVLIGIGLLCTLLWFAARIILTLPILLAEQRPAREAIAESVKRTQGFKLRIIAVLIAWAAASLLIGLLLGLPGLVLGKVLIPIFADHVNLLVFLLGGLLMTIFLSGVVANFLASAALGVALFEIYQHHKQLDENRPLFADSHEGTRLSIGQVAAVTSAIAVAAVLTGLWLIKGTDQPDRASITAHRGASGLAPENTIAAVERAIREGADWVEIDVQHSGDRQIVVIHDRDLRRVGNSSLVVQASPYAELRQIDIGGWFDPMFADQRLATLQQVLALCKDHVGLNIELKYYGWDEDLAPAVIDLVEQAGMVKKVKLMSLDNRAVTQAKTLRPEWQVGQLTAVNLGDLTRVEADFLAIHSNAASSSFIGRTHDSGKRIEVWTVNDTAGMHAMFSNGVDSIITDFPGKAVALRAQRAELDATQRLLLRLGLLMLDEPEHVDPAMDVSD